MNDQDKPQGTGACEKCSCKGYAPERTGGHCKNTRSDGTTLCNHTGTEHSWSVDQGAPAA